MKHVFAFILTVPSLALASGMNWTAFDLERCRPWYFDVGEPEKVSEEFKKKYHQEPYGQTANGLWTPVVATSNDNPTVFYFAECFQSNKDNTLRCNGYGEKRFPLGDAVFKLEKSKSTSSLPAYVCIRNCSSTRIKTIYDHPYEGEPPDENAGYITANKRAFQHCGEIGRNW